MSVTRDAVSEDRFEIVHHLVQYYQMVWFGFRNHYSKQLLWKTKLLFGFTTFIFVFQSYKVFCT